MRLFIALPIDDNLQEQILSLIDKYRDIDPTIKWVKKAQLHITLYFIGEVTEEKRIHALQDLLSYLEFSPISFELLGPGAFPDLRKSSSMHIKIFSEAMMKVHQQLTYKLQSCLSKVDMRPFIPHLTIARLKRPKPLSLRPFNEIYHEFNFSNGSINEVRLYKSRLHQEGALYSVLVSKSATN